MLTLYQFEPVWGLPNASPFCMKLETYFRMTGLAYQTHSSDDVLRKAPKGKLPYIEDNGQIIADSNLILEYLKTTYGDPLDQHLSPPDTAIALAMRRLLEENLYWALVYSRWVDPKNWPQTKAVYFSDLPPILRTIVSKIALNQVTQNLKGHGMGRHTASEIYQIATLDLQALSDFLQDKRYFMGSQPTTLDASAYSVLANILNDTLVSPLRDQALQLQNLVAYCDRMHQAYYA
ncbi:glutathione S-transferase family protein [Acaryochloris sp. IP29b_bin.148]|uniref:glutathione S-transferase family protein n=1 Tax=Acaryochloris sp. IP29b_bin.148 TaxID=2969218 RepID=UPI00263185C4|nr:glutathione S-transferase family protein [Acaryochloris sp. IP29b_bin.148]